MPIFKIKKQHITINPSTFIELFGTKDLDIKLYLSENNCNNKELF